MYISRYVCGCQIFVSKETWILARIGSLQSRSRPNVQSWAKQSVLKRQFHQTTSAFSPPTKMWANSTVQKCWFKTLAIRNWSLNSNRRIDHRLKTNPILFDNGFRVKTSQCQNEPYSYITLNSYACFWIWYLWNMTWEPKPAFSYDVNFENIF